MSRLRNPQIVVVPLDFSDPSDEALRAAAELVDSPAQLYCVHVLPELHPLDPAVAPDLTDKVRIDRATQNLRHHVKHLGFGDVVVHVAVGDPGHATVAYAERVGADLIVVASHGYRGVKHILLGSVAERIVRRAGCPVLVVRRTA